METEQVKAPWKAFFFILGLMGVGILMEIYRWPG